MGTLRWVLIGLLIVAFVGLRSWRLTGPCLWFDEIFSIHAAEHPWGSIIPFVAKDLIHPPLFYLILKVWTGVFGDAVFWVRTLPVLFSLLALAPLWMLCRELKLKESTAAVAVGLFAVNGALIKYAQEVRMYSLLLFLALMSIWLFSRYFYRGKSFWVLVIVNVFMVNTHYFGWFVVATEVTLIAYAQRIKIARTLLMAGITFLAFVPWLISIYRFAEPGSSVGQNIGWMRRPGITSLFEFAFDLVDPIYFQQSSIEPSANFVIAIPLSAILLASAVVYFVDSNAAERKDASLLLAAFAFVPLTLVFLASWAMPVSIWGSRHLLIVFPPIILLFAICLTEVRSRVLRYSLIGGMLTFASAAFAMQVITEPGKHIWCTFEELAGTWSKDDQAIGNLAELYVFEDLAAYHYWFATRRKAEARVMLVKDAEGMPNDPAYFLPRGFNSVKIVGLNEVESEELWVSFREGTIFPSTPTETGRFEVPVTNFENLGYAVAEVHRATEGSQTAYLIKMKKASRDTGP
jgi:uncharacterized membrane protein